MRAGILRLGNQQLAEVGAAALSVREIARGLGVASSAIYRHVANRDELLTLLIVDAYEDLASAALGGSAEYGDHQAHGDPHDPADRFAGIARGMRDWALRNPARWALAYGSPVPGYSAPASETNAPGTRVMTELLRALAEGEITAAEASRPFSKGLRDDLVAGTEEFGVTAVPETAAAAVGAWMELVGRISAEVFQQLGPEFAAHGEELLERWIHETVRRFGLGAGPAFESAVESEPR